MKSLSLFLLMLVFSAVVVHSQTAGEMASNCKGVSAAKVTDQSVEIPSDTRSGICWGAFLSIQFAIRYVGHQNLDGSYSPSIKPLFSVCARKGVDAYELVKVFVSYTDRHPERLHKEFFQVAMESAREAFPCGQDWKP